MSASFPQAVNFIALSVTTVKVPQRTIGALDQEQPANTIAFVDTLTAASSLSGTHFNYPNHGRGSYRGRAINSGGRMPSRSNSLLPNRLPGRGPGRGMVGMTRTAQSLTGYYTPEQWASLPRQQQDYILTQR